MDKSSSVVQSNVARSCARSPEEPRSDLIPSSSPTTIRCRFCSSSFLSRNKLFEHLREIHGHMRDESTSSSFSPFQCSRDRTAASIESRAKLHSLDHEAYYRLQCTKGKLMSTSDLEVTLKCFRKPLPVTFRLLSKSREDTTNARFAYIHSLRNLGAISASASLERKDTSFLRPLLRSSPYFDPSMVQVAAVPPREWNVQAQRTLSDAQNVGAANRQELSSMVPPLLLLMKENKTDNTNDDPGEQHDPHPTDRLSMLDLCAAPGSKTLQLLDLLPSYLRQKSTSSLKNVILVANDSNRNRLLTLARRLRLVSRCPCLLLNSSDGRYFPSLRKWGGYKLKFDRILADVPCSGDGTLRKLSSNQWAKWNVLTHLQLHKLQVRLLVRALQLVKKGGRVVYSTCSLDPIENEAVVASAIAQLGGPDVYKINPIPNDFCLGSNETTNPMPFVAGTKCWIVPDPAFSHLNQTYYAHYDEVHEKLRKTHILPSMFPPRANTRLGHESQPENGSSVSGDENGNLSESTNGSKEQVKYCRLTTQEALALEEMLPNCCRILPQHLDSGGFFCAIIERSNPLYFAVCCPLQRNKEHISSPFHGRIFHQVESMQQVRRFVASEKSEGEEIYFEGHSTLNGAVRWLRQHGAYVEGRSNSAVPIAEIDSQNASTRVCDTMPMRFKISPERQPRFTPLFRKPNTLLLSEFCNYYGLHQDSTLATIDKVQRFPAEDVVVVGGGTKASTVSSCASVGYTPQMSCNENGGNRRQKYFRLALVSTEIQSLFVGAAKFNPFDAGVTLSWIPIPDNRSNEKDSAPATGTVLSSSDGDHQNPISRNAQSGRYGLSDEAVEIIGRCATRRLMDLSLDETIELLKSSSLRNRKEKISTVWSDGGVIVRHSFIDQDPLQLFLSCRLTTSANNTVSLELLTERRIADSWLRLLQARKTTVAFPS